MLDKTRVDSGAKKHVSSVGSGSETSHVQTSHCGAMCDQDFCVGSPLHLGDEEDMPTISPMLPLRLSPLAEFVSGLVGKAENG